MSATVYLYLAIAVPRLSGFGAGAVDTDPLYGVQSVLADGDWMECRSLSVGVLYHCFLVECLYGLANPVAMEEGQGDAP